MIGVWCIMPLFNTSPSLSFPNTNNGPDDVVHMAIVQQHSTLVLVTNGQQQQTYAEADSLS